MGKLSIRIGPEEKKRHIPRIISLPLFVGALVGGGYWDLQNNQIDPSAEGSNPAVVEQYQEQISDMATLKGEGQDVSSQATEFFSSVYVNNQLSEADVASLTDEFTTKIAPPATLKGGYVLEHPEYLDEAKTEISARNLGALDQKTMQMHKEAMDDGPWGGAALGWLAYILVFNTLNAGVGALSRTMANRRRRPAKKPRGPYGSH